MPEPGRSLQPGLRLFLGCFLGALLAFSFWLSAGWLQLSAGLALFLFGMQCLEEALRDLAGGKLESLLARSTATPFKSLMFGVSATMLTQSSSLVSLLTIAFISSGLIKLAAGIAIIFGANLGTTSGIWLLALAGQNLSLGPLALPLLVFGVLAGFNGERSRAVGRLLLGIAFLFLGIDQMKTGFASVGGGFDPLHYALPGFLGQLAFVGVGVLVTVVLQSSHASLMLTLAALSSGQLMLDQGLAIAIGSNVGSTVTAVIGSLRGGRAGQRLALAHVLFNLVTALIALALLVPLGALVHWLGRQVGLGDNALIQLALFHTLFNSIGVLLFWPWQTRLAGLLERLLPEPLEPRVLITELTHPDTEPAVTHSRYLDDAALASADAAAHAVMLELQHLGRLSLEVICHALYLPVDQLSGPPDEARLRAQPGPHELDAEQLYRRHIKGVYADLLSFMSRLEADLDTPHQEFWVHCQLVALQLVDAVKDAKHLQKNLGRFLRQGDSAVRDDYVELRRHLLGVLRQVRELGRLELPEEAWAERLRELDEKAAQFDAAFRHRLFADVRDKRLDGLLASSLMNDLGYTSRITQSLRNVLLLGLGDGNEMFRAVRQLAPDDGRPLIRLD
ncbi:Na/Pi cotransporter family protein [Pseudomonas sp. PIC25]|uniref:Na/Pi cotransporter family protein n=1 Tax=Pseudomonas sp. PIC25 TaxID=1958773 RepID=UPI000BABCF56|nr:Na/Pi symporter [Pseudomonas sp. PIC25]